MTGEPSSRFARIIRKLWWLHSAWALLFGVGVMVFARQGLAYAETILIVLGGAWLLVFVGLRAFIGVEPADEKLTRKGARLVTNYLIKNLYQQMLFFLVPLYASSATWTWGSWNWVMPVVVAVFAVVSTMDLVFDNVVMRHRIVAAFMYGVCMFGVLNLVLPAVLVLDGIEALLIAAAATAPAVALLSFPLRTVFRPIGLIIVVASSGILVLLAWQYRHVITPVPVTMAFGGVGHGTPGQYECVPGRKRNIRVEQATRLRCAADIVSPGVELGTVIHEWRKDGREVQRVDATRMTSCEGDVYRSELTRLPDDPEGQWKCVVWTEAGQLLGQVPFTIGPSQTQASE